jgi:hypothetical protein
MLTRDYLFHDQLWRLDAAEFVYVEAIGQPDRTTDWQSGLVECDRIDDGLAVGRLDAHFQVIFADDSFR